MLVFKYKSFVKIGTLLKNFSIFGSSCFLTFIPLQKGKGEQLDDIFKC